MAGLADGVVRASASYMGKTAVSAFNGFACAPLIGKPVITFTAEYKSSENIVKIKLVILLLGFKPLLHHFKISVADKSASYL